MKNYIITAAIAAVVTGGGAVVVLDNNEVVQPLQETVEVGLYIKSPSEGMYHLYAGDTGFFYMFSSYEEIEQFAFVVDREGNRVRRKVDEGDDALTVEVRRMVGDELLTKNVQEFVDMLIQY